MNLPQTAAHSFDATAATFEQEVLLRSMQTPVLIDFWAPWCAPCKQLKPVLEKLAEEFAGAFVLAKVNTDDEMQLASLFGIRSLPTVMLLKGGQPVDGFMGAQPESVLRQFLAQHGVAPLAGEAVEDVAPADEATVDPWAEVDRLRGEIAAEPDKDELKLDLALAMVQVGETEEAGALLDALPAKLAADDRAKRARATLGFAAQLRDAPSPQALVQRLQAEENDHAARHALGVHALVAGDAEAALELFLDLLRRDRTFGDGLARRSLIDAFAVIDDEDLVGRYRRKMASLLF